MQENLAEISVSEAIHEVKVFEWEGDYRPAAQAAIKEVLETRMAKAVDAYLAEIEAKGGEDRRNGYYERHLLTEIGDVTVAVHRTRTFSANGILKAYARRSASVDRMILECFTLGLSTRKVGRALLHTLGEQISASTVSNVARQLDNSVKAYQNRPLSNQYRFLFFDGVVLKRKTGMGSMKRVVLVALGITHDGKKQVIDFRIVRGESENAWEAFLNNLYQRGLTGDGVELIATDGGRGLLAALDFVYSDIPHQRCWAHKARNVINCVRVADQDAVKTDLHKISHAKNLRSALSAARRFRLKWAKAYPKAVESLKKDLDALLAFFLLKDTSLWPQVRTTNAIERRFVEVRRRTRPMGVFSDRTSMERILFAVFTYENTQHGSCTPFPLTQSS